MAIIWHNEVLQRLLDQLQEHNVSAALFILKENIQAEAPVRTGFLRDSIETNYKEGIVVALAPYASYVNYGTYKMAANPFFERGIINSLGEIKDRLGQKVSV
jgi:hypothetical protein